AGHRSARSRLNGYPGSHRDLRPLALGGDLGHHRSVRLLVSHARRRASPVREVPGVSQHGQRVEEHRRQQEMIAELGQPDIDRRHKPHSLSSDCEGTSDAAPAAGAPAAAGAVGDVTAGVVPGGALPGGPRSPAPPFSGAPRAADSSVERSANSAPNVSDDSVRVSPANSTVLPPPAAGAARRNTRRRRTRNDTSRPASAAIAAKRAGSGPGAEGMARL